MVRVDDLIPFASGQAQLGVNAAGTSAFDITSIAPFGHIHQLSGVFHDELAGQSGIIRYSRQQAAFQVSVDGGLTFSNLSAGGVDSIGQLGGTNLVGNVDFATPASGFLIIDDTSDASPLIWAVDQLGLSGLWDFPTQGFNGRVVNALTDANGTEAQGVINVVGASGLIVDIVGQTMTIGPAANQLAQCIEDAFAGVNTHTVTHNFNTTAVIVQVRDASDNILIPDTVAVDDVNNVTVTFNGNRTGTVVIIGC